MFAKLPLRSFVNFIKLTASFIFLDEEAEMKPEILKLNPPKQLLNYG